MWGDTIFYRTAVNEDNFKGCYFGDETALGADLISLMATQIGFGGLIGFVVGFAIKKLIKLLLVAAGLFFLGLQLLAYEGYITINWQKFEFSIADLAHKLPEFAAGNPLSTFLVFGMPFGASFVLGLLLGLKKG